jgi:hypothetical protein
MEILLVILTIVFLVGMGAGLVLQHRLYCRLSTQYPQALVILAESSAGILAFQRYLWKRQYVGLGDRAFSQRADFLRRYWEACLLFFFLVVVTLVVAVSP